MKKDIFVPQSKDTIKVYEQQNAIKKDWTLSRYYITKGYFNSHMKQFVAKAGDLIVSCAGTIGEIYELPQDAEEGVFNQALMRVQVNDEAVNKEIFITVFSSMIDKFSKIYSNGSAIKNIPPFADLKKTQVFLPCKEEQKKIAKLLALLDERIVTQSKIIEDLKRLKSAIIDYAINSLHCDFVKFGTLYEMAGEGGTPATSNAAYYDNGNIPFIKIDDLKQKYLTENKDFITELGLQKSSAWLIPTHSILFSNGATIGEISITTYPVCTKQGILGIVPKQNIDVEFLYYLMSSSYFKKAVSRIVTEGTMKTAYLKDINNILCPIPTKERQHEIAKMPSALNSKIDFEQSILKLFGLQKQYLLRQMFI